MDFGVFFAIQDYDDYLYGIKEAENHGFDFIGIIDSPYNFMDCYPILGAAALETETIEMGPFVTNPLTRHPSVTASAMATVDIMSDGRAFLGIGRGDSAVKMLGWKPAKWKIYDQSIKDMRSWMRGQPVELEGAPAPVQLLYCERDIPILMGVFGPRGAKSAGELGDIASTECAELGAVEWFNDDTQKAAKAAGRDPIPFEVSIATYISDDRAKAIEQCRWEPEILTNLIWGLVSRYGIDALPASLTRGFEWLAEKEDWWGEHDWSKHAKVDDAHQQIISDEIVERFCVLGTPQDVIDKLRELEKLGVSRFCAYLVSLGQSEILEQLKLWGDHVIPEFK